MNGIEVTYFFISMFIAVFVELLFLNLAPRLGMMDCPNIRKHHDKSTPVIGGLAIYVALLSSLFLLNNTTEYFNKIITLSFFLVVLGALDDRFPIKASVRFVAQIIFAAILIEWTGNNLEDLGSLFGQGVVVLVLLAIPVTILGIVGIINAVNFSDGLDGLAGGYVLIAFIYLFLIALNADQVLLVNELSIIMGALFAFLLFNGRYFCKSRAKIFMGDAGSMLLGFLLAWYFISMSQGQDRLITPVTALWLFSMPLFDTVGIIIRRILKGRAPFKADREHLHHVFLHAGFSKCKTVNLMLLASTILGSIGLLGHNLGVPESLMFVIFIMLFIAYFYAMMRAWRLTKVLRNVHKKNL